jgi:hypothetical protein
VNERAPGAFEPVLSRADAGIVVALAALSLLWFSLGWSHTLDLRDEGYLLSRSMQVAQGALPHRDFVDVYGPLGLLLSGRALEASDGQIMGVRHAIGVLKCIAVVLAFVLARLLVPRGPAVFAALLSMLFWGRLAANLNTPYPALFTVTLCMASALAVAVGHSRRSRWILLAAGVLAGLGILFKQSLGIMNVYGLGLALWGMGLLDAPVDADERAGPRSRTGARLAVGLWWIGGVAALAPVAAFLGAGDYLLHFALLHLTLGVLGWMLLSGPAFAFPLDVLRDRLLPFGLGALAVVLVTALVYASWDSLGRMLHDMFVIPRSYQDYYQPVIAPRASVALLSAGLLLGVQAGLWWLRNRRQGALVWAGCGLAAFAGGLIALRVGSPKLFSADGLLHAPITFDSVLAFVTSAAALAVVLPDLTRERGGVVRRRAMLALPLLFAQLMLAYQVFPRAGHNLWTIHGMLPPLLVFALYRWADPQGFTAAQRGRAWAASFLVVIVPLWWVSPVAWKLIEPTPRRELALPRAEGISLPLDEIRDLGLASVETLVAHLSELEPSDAPLLLLTNEEMIRFSSGRPHVFPKREFHFFLAGWGLIPELMLLELDGEGMIEQLRAQPDAIVVSHGDVTFQNIRKAMPRLMAELERTHKVTARFGPYRVLRARAFLDQRSDSS